MSSEDDVPTFVGVKTVNRADITFQTLISASVADGTLTLPPEPEPPDPVVRPPELPECIDERYERRTCIGRGGMGEVWRVWDRALHRSVALKVLHGVRSPSTWARFEEEARVAAQLQHPGIIPVHDLGHLGDGRLWFTMKEVRGRTLGELIEDVHRDWRLGREGVWTFRRLLEGMLRVCETLAYAHARGVVHRDIKPSNVMFGDYGEVLVLDWGIAKVLGEAAADEEAVHSQHAQDLTRVGVVSGTPSYMAPEQAQGRSNEAGAAADVYALGATLYDLLAERPPRVAKNVRQLLFQTATGTPPIRPPSIHGTGAPIDDALDEIVLTALAVEEVDRFSSAGELADELRAWLDGAKKRERARALVAEAGQWLASCQREQGEADRLKVEAETKLSGLAPDSAVEEKAEAWALEDAARAADRRSRDARTRAIQTLRASLTHAPDFEESHNALAEVFRARHQLLERMGRHDEARSVAADLAQHDRGQHAAYLKGTGAITLITDVPVEVRLHRFVEKGRRLEPIFERNLGTTPLVNVPVAMGNYLLTLHADGHPVVRYPVWLRRQEHWDGVAPGESDPRVIRIPGSNQLAADDVYVPAGWFWSGDDRAESTLPLERQWTEGFVIKKHPVTVGEYVSYLNDLLDSGRESEAVDAEPFIALEGPYFERDADGRWVGIAPDIEGLETWPRTPDMPVTLVTHGQAEGYAAWRAAREGRPWRLPTLAEWVHAARGADRRVYPWGDFFDANWALTRDSPGNVGARPVNMEASDVSVFGLAGASGNVTSYVIEDGRAQAMGGSAAHGPLTARITRVAAHRTATFRHPVGGFRVAIDFR